MNNTPLTCLLGLADCSDVNRDVYQEYQATIQRLSEDISEKREKAHLDRLDHIIQEIEKLKKSD